jgi:predicted Zn finger-like uncharacterized protein
MALATRCPHCKTTFKVANDQLKLRAGLVRCGACKEIFNGIEHLLRPDTVEKLAADTAPATAPPPTPVTEAEPAVKQTIAPVEEARDIASFLRGRPVVAEAGSEFPEPAEAEQPRYVAPAGPPDYSYKSAENDPLQRMTLMDFSYADDEPGEEGATAGKARPEQLKPDPDQPDPLEEAIEALQRKPLRGTKQSGRKHRKAAPETEDSEGEEPSFVKQGRRRERISRALRPFMGIGSGLLLAALIAQSAYVFRNQVAVWFPQAKPAISRACAILHCQVGLPAQIEAVSIESSELQALAPEKNAFSLTFLLRNHSGTPQAWPNIELTLNDANEKAIARRVFIPRDYLGTQQDLTGFAAKSEQSFKLFFELSEIKASGYRVYLFYP